ncbi:MAG: squalene synthase HpnC [Firmicutes bacterium]|nr:squalene synthase HpnC [Bacillota bacterium]
MSLAVELDIARHLPPTGCSVAEAQAYTRWLATHHYENFTVVSWLLPRRLRQHFYNVYAYCRWADDLGDEVADARRALALLDEWEAELHACYAGRPRHPVFVALRSTIEQFAIPIEPLADLLQAFRQDQSVHRYPDWAALHGYCRYSANPVGHLVLYLCGYRDAERQRLADATCTALQLANFWQDVSRDLDKGRLYIPLDALARHGLSEADIVARRFDARYVSLMQELIAHTRELFARGRPLARLVAPELRVDLELFTRGGEAVLEAIERIGYNTLARRPTVRRGTQARLFGRALLARLFAPLAAGPAPDCLPLPRRGAPDPAPATGATHLDAAYAGCERLVRAAHTNFYFAFHLLPRPKRRALCALYAFMRRADDIADGPGSAEEKAERLRQLGAELHHGLARASVADPVLAALADTVQRYAIPHRLLDDLLSGAAMDLTVRTYARFEDLRDYCYRVAGTVGLCCLQVFGYRDARAPELAEQLGIAFQLTNILRDLREDFERGRIYLPEEDLQRFGCTGPDLPRHAAGPELRRPLAQGLPAAAGHHRLPLSGADPGRPEARRVHARTADSHRHGDQGARGRGALGRLPGLDQL